MLPQDIGRNLCKACDEFIEGQPSTAKWDELRERLLKWFHLLSEPLAFEGMLWVFEYSNRYQHQLLAGELLVRRGVPLMISPDEFIRRVAPRLNASVRDVATYLKEQIGVEAARREVMSVARDCTDKRSFAGLQCLHYWLGIDDPHVEMEPTSLPPR